MKQQFDRISVRLQTMKDYPTTFTPGGPASNGGTDNPMMEDSTRIDSSLKKLNKSQLRAL